MANVLRFASPVFDSFRNFLTGIGMPGADKNTTTHWAFAPIDMQQLEAAYRGDWMARKIIDIPAYDCTRAWRQWHGTKEQITALNNTEKDFGLQRKMMSALTKSRLYGGAAIIMGVDSGTFQQELKIEEVKKGDLKFAHVVSSKMLAAGPRVREITSPWFGEPTYYQRSSTATTPPIGGVEPIGEPTMGQKEGDILYIHPSRVIRLIGNEYPDMENAPDAWGDSVLQTVQDAVKQAGITPASLTTIISEAKLDIIKVPGLTNKMQTEAGTQALFNRFNQANLGKSILKALLLDKEDEWERTQLQLSNWDEVINMFFLVCCAAADIPATRFMGREPAGLNATGDSDMRNYHDRLSSDQKVRLTPALARLDEVIIRHTFGSRDEKITYDWNPLYQLSDTEKADAELKAAQAHQVDVNSGLISPHVLQTGRQNHLIESGWLYPGMEAAIEEEGEWDAEEGMQGARTGGMADPNDPEIITHKAKALATIKQSNNPPKGKDGNQSGRGGNDEP